MKIEYNKVRAIATSELPGVICHPPLVFDFLAAPTMEQWNDLAKWSTAENTKPKETLRLAAMYLQGVTTHDGNYFELGTISNIAELVDQTELSFIANVLRGFQQRIALERIADLKKFQAPLTGSNVNGAQTGQVKEC